MKTASGVAAVIAVLLLVASPVESEYRAGRLDPFSFGNSAFCTAGEPVRDFGLAQLPPVREVPETGESMGHPAVKIYGGGMFGSVMPEPASFGYRFSERNHSGTVLLNWKVSAQLWAVDPGGTPTGEVDRGELFIGRLDAAHQPSLSLWPPSDLGFYRFDIQFTDLKGKRVGAYSAYFKIERRFWRARLGLNGRRFRPGQLVLSRVENLGTEVVLFGEAFSVQRLEPDGGWAHVPKAAPRIWALWLGGAWPGRSGRCSALWLPDDLPSGRYRIVKEVGPSPWPDGELREYLVAPFDVVD